MQTIPRELELLIQKVEELQKECVNSKFIASAVALQSAVVNLLDAQIKFLQQRNKNV